MHLMQDVITPSPSRIFGEVCGYYVVPQPGEPDLWVRPAVFKASHNDILYEWATVMCQLLSGSPDGKPYNLGAMYIEYENNGGAAVTAPTVTRADGKTYYSSLSSDPNRDYLRIPLTAVITSSTDATNYPDGNKIIAFGQTAGVAGVHGKTFSDAVSSRVYGGSLVVTPDYADQTQDLVFSRFYFDSTDKQLIKPASAQLGLEWDVTHL